MDYRLEIALARAKEALEETRQQMHKAAVVQWREKLRVEDKFLTRWLKQETQCLPASVKYQGISSKSHDEALLDLWKQARERDLDCQARRQTLHDPDCQFGRDASPIEGDWRITPEELFHAARAAEGAAGPDGVRPK